MVRFFIVAVACVLISFSVLAEVKPYFTPSKECERKIIGLVEKSEKTIDVAIYALSNGEIVKAIEAAHDRGVKLRILTDKLQAAGRYSKVTELHDYGVNVRVHSKHKIEHNKFAVFDDDKVVTGSYNWTDSATRSNSENCLFIIRNQTAVKEYMDRFNYLWQVNTKKKSEEWFEGRKDKTDE